LQAAGETCGGSNRGSKRNNRRGISPVISSKRQALPEEMKSKRPAVKKGKAKKREWKGRGLWEEVDELDVGVEVAGVEGSGVMSSKS